MDKWMQAAIIIGVCVVVVLLVRFKKAGILLLNFLFRTVIGAAVIWFGNKILLYFQITDTIGLNFITLLTCGFLGIPGAAGLFVLRFLLFL